MDHPVNPTVKKLANTLIENSPTNWSEALNELNELGALTAAAFEPEKIEVLEVTSVEQNTIAAEEKVSAPSPTPATRTTAPKPSVQIPERYDSEHLKDQKVLDALLSYHRMHAPVVGATTSPKPAKNSTRSIFSPMQIPIIDAAPKSKSVKQTGSSGIASTILKPKK